MKKLWWVGDISVDLSNFSSMVKSAKMVGDDAVVSGWVECSRHKGLAFSSVLTAVTNKSGATFVRWFCWHCKAHIDWLKPITHSDVNKALPSIVGKPGLTYHNLPAFGSRKPGNECIVCSNPFTSMHHFAPKFIFGSDADKWPVLPLCDSCHLEWHQKVTPGMSKKEAGQ